MNTNIALQGRGVRLPQRNALAPYQQANAMLQLKANKQNMERQNALRQELQGVTDQNQRADILFKYGQIDDATKLQQHVSNMAAADRKKLMEQHEIVGQLASGVDSQEAWNRVRPQIEQFVGPMTEDEAIYSPDTVKMLTAMGLKAKDVRELENQDRTYKLNVKKANETRRHNQETEAISKSKAGHGFSVTSPDGTVIHYGQGGAMQAPKGAQTQLFKDVVDGQTTLDSIAQIEALYEPDFLTYGGALKGNAATFLNKMNPNQRSQFQARRSKFISAANREFLAYRKWATGVAGGEKEMAEIKRATFSEDDSPQDFEAKLQLAKSLTRRLNARKKASLAAGVDNEAAFKEFIKANPLENIPTMQQRGDQLMNMGYTEQQVLELLKQEGYY